MKKPSSPLVFVLKAFLPYTRQNLMLTFKPNRFFDELERISNYKRKTLESAYYRARKNGLILNNNKLSLAGEEKILPFTARKLQKDVVLMVIFDIPEEHAKYRREFRGYLRRPDFAQTQQSVWTSTHDYTKHTKSIVEELGIGEFVQIYEAARIC